MLLLLQKLLSVYLIYFLVSLAKVVVVKYVGEELVNVIDEFLFVQIFVFLLWIVFIVLNKAGLSKKEKIISFFISLFLFAVVVLLSVYVSYVFWLELGLRY
jgi:hypothetical protein